MSSIYDWSVVAANNSNSDAAITWAEGQAPSTVNNSARQLEARVRELLTDIGGSIAAGGTANGLTITMASAFTALADGQIVAFRATASNTGAATLNVNSIGAKAIRKMDTTGDIALVANDIRNTGIYIAQYSAALNGAAGAWLLVNPTSFASLTAANTFTSIQRWAKGADVASAAALPIVTDGNYVHVTGVAAITSIATHAAGTWVALEFDAALTLTHNATTLILPGAANITTAAGDIAIMVSEGGGNWRCMNYQRAALTAYKPPTVQIISTPGAFVYTPTAGAKFADIELCGGGGAGGNVDGVGVGSAAAGGGGASGFYGRTGPISITGAATFNGTIGAAGAVAGGTSADGGVGGDTSITVGATTYTAGGGTGGGGMIASTTPGGSQDGGAPGVGTNLVGFSQVGMIGVYAGGSTNATGGNGGSSPFGSGGKGQHRSGAGGAGGLPAAGFGGGGGGASNCDSSANNVGGAGTGGYARIMEYF